MTELADTTEVTVRVDRRVLGWKLGHIITVERTGLIDKLIRKGSLTEIEYPTPEQIENAERPRIAGGKDFSGNEHSLAVLESERAELALREAREDAARKLGEHSQSLTGDISHDHTHALGGGDDGSTGAGDGDDEQSADPDGSTETGPDSR